MEKRLIELRLSILEFKAFIFTFKASLLPSKFNVSALTKADLASKKPFAQTKIKEHIAIIVGPHALHFFHLISTVSWSILISSFCNFSISNNFFFISSCSLSIIIKIRVY
jgi:hypothetical protein